MALCTGGSDRYVRGFTGGGIDKEGDRSPRGAFDDLRNPGAIIIYFYGQVVPGIIQFPECGLNEVVTVFYRIELFPGSPYFPEVSRVPALPTKVPLYVTFTHTPSAGTAACDIIVAAGRGVGVGVIAAG